MKFKYFSVLLLLIGSLFIGCGDTDVDVKSSNVSVTTSDGINYNFNGSIIVEWRTYGTTLRDNDRLEVKNVSVEVDGKTYTTNWTWSKKIEDLKASDIADRETDVSFGFDIPLPKSTSDRYGILRYTISLDGDNKNGSIDCKIPAK